MKGSAVLSALLILLTGNVWAADDMTGAVRELARKTVAFAGRGEPVSINWRNLSTLGSGDLNQARTAFDTALREAGARVIEKESPASGPDRPAGLSHQDLAPVVEVRATLTDNASQFLLVEEARRGEERQIWMAFWKRPAPTGASAGTTLTLEKKLVWEQEEQILDVVMAGTGMLVLSPSRVMLRAASGNANVPLNLAINEPLNVPISVPISVPSGVPISVPINPPRPWPRDLRGHLRFNGGGFKAYLPGVVCSGAVEPALDMECHPSEEPWTVDAGSRGVLLASFTPGRNYFDGRVSTSNGVRKTLAPFFSAVSAEENGQAYWLVAMLEGRTQVLDAVLEPLGSVASWGSDLAGTEAHCGGGSQILATQAGEAREPDAVRAYGLANQTPVALSAPLDFPGPVTALWSLGGSTALAVVSNLVTGRYQAYLITVNCGG